MLDRLILAHPRDIGETYVEHAGHALHIGGRMIWAGIACLVHALLPGLFARTASETLEGIQALMAKRMAEAALAATANPGTAEVEVEVPLGEQAT